MRPETSAPTVQRQPAQAAPEDYDVTHERQAIAFVSHTESANEHSPNQFNPESTCMCPDPLWPQPTSHE